MDANAINLAHKLYSRDSLHLKRKCWHILSGCFGLFLFFKLDLDVSSVRLFCLSLTILFLIFEFLRLKFLSLNKFFIRYASPFMRKSEVNRVTGLPFYSCGIWLSLTFFQLEIALLSIMFLIFADPISSLIGNLYGREKFLPNKSVEGTLSCFLVCYAITFFYLKSSNADMGMSSVIFSVFAGLLGAGSEAVSAFKIDDNLSIPFLSGLGLTYLNTYFHFF